MPIYEYTCRKCEHRFESLVRKPSETPKTCPKCGTAKPVKAFSSFAVASAGALPQSCADRAESGASCPSGRRCSSDSCPMAGE